MEYRIKMHGTTLNTRNKQVTFPQSALVQLLVPIAILYLVTYLIINTDCLPLGSIVLHIYTSLLIHFNHFKFN